MGTTKRQMIKKLPSGLMKDIRRSRALIAKELPELIEKGQRLRDAKNEPTVSGALRRAIHSSKLLLPDLADRAETDMDALDAFLTDERPLDSDVIDRLARVLKLRLETTNGSPKSKRVKSI